MDQTSNALYGIGKTLRDVVAPAVTATDPLAQQELRMAMRYIEFLRVRVDHLYARARFELGFHIDLAETVGRAVGGGAVAKARERGVAALGIPGAPIGELRDRSAEIAAAVSELVRDAQDGPTRTGVERAVVAAYERITVFERSWYQPLGMDHFGDDLAPIESFLAPMAAGSAPGTGG